MNLTRQPIAAKSERVFRGARENARGQCCTLRLSGCLTGTETVVLAHIRHGSAGTAQKPPDWFAVFACASCHDALDRRSSRAEWGWDDVLRALRETLEIQFREGVFQ